ncbi:MAG: P-loop containing nucleoside triphosphate hydrolase protein, partial [Olpidium bornovanus]
MKNKKRRNSRPRASASAPASASDGDGAAVVATSQVSRFHNETVETLSNDVDLKQVNVVVGDRHLLVDADLKLMSGVKYGLVGQNGVGKSTLLRCIGRKTLVGLPTNLRVLYVEQLEGADPAQSVVGTVLASDAEVVRQREVARELSAALETRGAADVARTVRRLRLRAREDERRRADDVAARRSGGRGHAARQRLVEAEGAVEAAREADEREPTEGEANRSLADAQAMLAEALAVLDVHDEGAAEGKARSILAGLGFSEERQDGPVSSLSGGDEPTNHLDLPAVLWLQKYVSELQDVTVVTVSHDRAFIDAVSEQTIIFRDQKLFYYEGSYDAYVKNAEDKHLYQVRMAEAIDRKKAAAKKSVEAGMVQARKAGDDKKMAAMASKQRKLDQIGLEVNEKGHRFKLNVRGACVCVMNASAP